MDQVQFVDENLDRMIPTSGGVEIKVMRRSGSPPLGGVLLTGRRGICERLRQVPPGLWTQSRGSSAEDVGFFRF